MANQLLFTQGDTPLIKVPITVGGVVQDLTGWTAFFTLTHDDAPTSDDDADIKLECTLDPTAIALFQTAESDTDDLLASGTKYYWDVKLKDPTGNFFTTIVGGTALINQSYTKRTS